MNFALTQPVRTFAFLPRPTRSYRRTPFVRFYHPAWSKNKYIDLFVARICNILHSALPFFCSTLFLFRPSSPSLLPIFPPRLTFHHRPHSPPCSVSACPLCPPSLSLAPDHVLPSSSANILCGLSFCHLSLQHAPQTRAIFRARSVPILSSSLARILRVPLRAIPPCTCASFQPRDRCPVRFSFKM